MVNFNVLLIPPLNHLVPQSSLSPLLSPGGGALGLPPYPPLLQGGVDRFAAASAAAAYPVMQGSLLQQSMHMYMAHYMPQVRPTWLITCRRCVPHGLLHAAGACHMANFMPQVHATWLTTCRRCVPHGSLHATGACHMAHYMLQLNE